MAKKRGNNEGSISKRKDGRWMGRYTVHAADGPKQRAVYGKTRKEVSEKLTKAMAERDNGVVYDDENLTVGAYLDKWLGGLKGAMRESTLSRYEIAIRCHIKPSMGRVRLRNLSPAHLSSFYQSKLSEGHAPASVNKLHVTLHKALGQAVKWGMIPRNVASVVQAPRPAPEEMRTLTAEEVRALLDAARGDRLEALYVMAVYTGMRQGELLALKWQDMDLEDGYVSVRRTLTRGGGLLLGEPKTKKSRRTIRLTATAVEALHAHLARQLEEMEQMGSLYRPGGLVFANEVGGIINPSNLRQRSFARLLGRAGLPPMRFHDLRHTCATLLLGSNVHPKYVQEILGHANIAISLDSY